MHQILEALALMAALLLFYLYDQHRNRVTPEMRRRWQEAEERKKREEAERSAEERRRWAAFQEENPEWAKLIELEEWLNRACRLEEFRVYQGDGQKEIERLGRLIGEQREKMGLHTCCTNEDDRPDAPPYAPSTP